jgi:hypothetical protein
MKEDEVERKVFRASSGGWRNFGERKESSDCHGTE